MKYFWGWITILAALTIVESGYGVPRVEYSLAIKKLFGKPDLKAVLESEDLTEPQVLEMFEDFAFNKKFRSFKRQILQLAIDQDERETSVSVVAILIQSVLLSERKNFSLAEIANAVGVDLEQESDPKTQIFRDAFDKIVSENAVRYVEDPSSPEFQKYRRKTLILGLHGKYGGALKMQNSILQNRLRIYGIFEFRWRNGQGEVIEQDLSGINDFEQEVNFEIELLENKMEQVINLLSQLDYLQ